MAHFFKKKLAKRRHHLVTGIITSAFDPILARLNVHRSVHVHSIERHPVHLQRRRSLRHDGLQLQRDQVRIRFTYLEK